MAYYLRVLAGVNAACPFLRATQARNLALLISAILLRRTLCLSQLARALPAPEPDKRRCACPKHDLLHRLKRLWRFVDNGRVDPMAVQRALIPHTLAQLGISKNPRYWKRLGLAIDWTYFDAHLPSGKKRRYQVLRIAVPCHGRALPLLQIAYDRDALPRSQNQLEEEALLAVVEVLPAGVRPVVLADRGFARASFFSFLQEQRLHFVIRFDKGTCLTEKDGRRWKTGPQCLQPGQVRWCPQVHYSLYHGRPSPVVINVVLCWRVAGKHGRDPRRKKPKEPWYLATNLGCLGRTIAWYWRRGWIEQSFKDSKSLFGLSSVLVETPERLSRLLMALTFALSFLTLLALPKLALLPQDWQRRVSAWGKLSLIRLALEWLEAVREIPWQILPQRPAVIAAILNREMQQSGYA